MHAHTYSQHNMYGVSAVRAHQEVGLLTGLPCLEGWSALSPKKSPACFDRSSDAGMLHVTVLRITFHRWSFASQICTVRKPWS